MSRAVDIALPEHSADTPREMPDLLGIVHRARAHAAADPFGNPILSAALAISRRLDDGLLTEAELTAIIAAVRDEAMANRASRLRAYVGGTDIGTSTAALSRLAAELVAHLGRASFPGGLLNFTRNRRATGRLARDVDLQPPDLDRPVSAFSGGNQQKIVVAKGLFRAADIYIFVEPTVGVDIGARAKLYGLIRTLSRRAAVLVISSDCDEVHGLADRVMALYKGRPIQTSDHSASRDQLLAAGIMGARAA